MIRSIRSRLLTGFALSGVTGAIVLAVMVVIQYDLLNASATSTMSAHAEIYEHVILPLAIFLALFTVGAIIVVKQVEHNLIQSAKEISRAATRLESYEPDLCRFPDELHPFVEAVGELTQRLAGHAIRQEAFAADAAHELKTPLAILALEIDRLSELEACRLREHIRSLSDMIDQLLQLARINAVGLSSSDTLIEPSKLVQTVVENLAPSAIQAGRELAADVFDASRFSGLEEAVQAAVRTLVVNAIRATPIGGRITVVAGPGATISVLDEGPGLQHSELERLKARGVRADSAPGGTAGLGLAIADRIAEAHGGELQTCLPNTPGLRLVFPAHAKA